MRAALRGVHRACVSLAARELTDAELRRSALVFAPHADDETLGCGGTIARKRRLGASVKIVIASDGSRSHAGLISAAELRALRAREVVAAARELGIARRDVIGLGLPDGELEAHRDAATERIAALLARERPDEVFVPYHLDPPADHQATARMVLAALRQACPQAVINEYPIWLWHHWPWGAPLPRGRRALRELRRSLASSWRLLRDCRWFVRVDGFLGSKRAALAAHRSQMQRLVDDPAWRTLVDAGGGEFLACFLGGREVFYRHSLSPGAP
jgi:LmbE family N-acetylglucosaminyl deacetylase